LKSGKNIGKCGLDSGVKIQKENIQIEVEPDEVSLKSFKLRDSLENHIWGEDGRLDLSVRRVLMDVSDDFWETCNIRWVKPKTVLLTGSICNYNWSEFSDVDVHLVVDFSEVHERKDFVQEYFNEKKNEWNNEHGKLNVYGFPIEMYVEDVDAGTVSGGVYDLWKNEWVREPKHGRMKPIMLNKYVIKQVAADLMTEIDELCDEFEAESDSHKVGVIGDRASELLDKIGKIRKIGLKNGGESSSGNVVYKVLKRAGYLERLWKLSADVYDKLNSLDEEKSFNMAVSVMF
jgi:hypothetical protein